MLCLLFGSWILWFVGYPDQAVQRNHETCALAQELPDPANYAYALFSAARLSQLRRDANESSTLAEAAISLAREKGAVYYLAMATFIKGWARFWEGEQEEGMDQMHQGLTQLRAVGSEVTRPTFLSLLAESYGQIDRVEEGLTLIEEAWLIAGKSGQQYSEAELH